MSPMLSEWVPFILSHFLLCMDAARQRRGICLTEWVARNSDEGLTSPMLSEWVPLVLSHF